MRKRRLRWDHSVLDYFTVVVIAYEIISYQHQRQEQEEIWPSAEQDRPLSTTPYAAPCVMPVDLRDLRFIKWYKDLNTDSLFAVTWGGCNARAAAKENDAAQEKRHPVTQEFFHE